MKTHKTTPAVRRMTGTRKTTFLLITCESVNMRGGWSDGSRSEYNVDRIDCLAMSSETVNAMHRCIGDHFSQQSTAYIIPPGHYVIETGTFNGKPSRPTFYCRPEDEGALLTRYGVSIPNPA